jgi:hypothetical protein
VFVGFSCIYLLGVLIFKGLTARCLYKSFGIKWLEFICFHQIQQKLAFLKGVLSCRELLWCFTVPVHVTKRVIASIFARAFISDGNIVKDSSLLLYAMCFRYCDLLCRTRFISVINEHHQNKIQSMDFKIRCSL